MNDPAVLVTSPWPVSSRQSVVMPFWFGPVSVQWNRTPGRLAWYLKVSVRSSVGLVGRLVMLVWRVGSSCAATEDRVSALPGVALPDGEAAADEEASAVGEAAADGDDDVEPVAALPDGGSLADGAPEGVAGSVRSAEATVSGARAAPLRTRPMTTRRRTSARTVEPPTHEPAAAPPGFPKSAPHQNTQAPAVAAEPGAPDVIVAAP